jgi:adenosylmethionine-8-amino-7-oxononanoate aminotransferase
LEARDGGYLAGIGPKLQAFFGRRNLLLRPLGNTIYVMPPYCVTAADLDEIYAAIKDSASI